jgi:hypothetical protein
MRDFDQTVSKRQLKLWQGKLATRRRFRKSGLITLVFMMRGGETRFQGRFMDQTIFENMRY